MFSKDSANNTEFWNNAQTTSGNNMRNGKQYGLIILGNSGVGKSFLANILVGRDAFEHKFSSVSITHTTEFQEIIVGYLNLAIFNIPGLIEANQERIDLNKGEIDKAFAQRPNSLVMYVFGQTNGRIKDEDVVAFNAINEAYPFRAESLVLVVNGLPKKRPADYEGSTLVLLQQLLKGVDWNKPNLCFLDHINDENPEEKQHLKERLLRIVVEFTPSHHKKVREIETARDHLKQREIVIKEQQKQFEAEREKYKQVIDESQGMIKDMDAKHKNELQSLQRAIERQEEMIAEQKRRSEEENQRHQTELQGMRTQLDGTQRNFDLMSKSNEATLAEVQASRKAYENLQRSYEELKNRPPTVQHVYHDDDDDDSFCIIS